MEAPLHPNKNCTTDAPTTKASTNTVPPPRPFTYPYPPLYPYGYSYGAPTYGSYGAPPPFTPLFSTPPPYGVCPPIGMILPKQPQRCCFESIHLPWCSSIQLIKGINNDRGRKVGKYTYIFYEFDIILRMIIVFLTS